jgi:hypothetical protein
MRVEFGSLIIVASWDAFSIVGVELGRIIRGFDQHHVGTIMSDFR